ncbi:MAG TPA: hypothetical protein VNF73_09560 [Candidatus Saccharimonadales bacterium]|nr:hypothetical protein [Candidatus Saccharimonadales bacterium]
MADLANEEYTGCDELPDRFAIEPRDGGPWSTARATRPAGLCDRPFDHGCLLLEYAFLLGRMAGNGVQSAGGPPSIAAAADARSTRMWVTDEGRPIHGSDVLPCAPCITSEGRRAIARWLAGPEFELDSAGWLEREDDDAA